MDTSTRDKINVTCNLLETLAHLQITFKIDHIYVWDREDCVSDLRVQYVDGEYYGS